MVRFLKKKLKVFKKREFSNYLKTKKIYKGNLYIHGTTNNIFLTLTNKGGMLLVDYLRAFQKY